MQISHQPLGLMKVTGIAAIGIQLLAPAILLAALYRTSVDGLRISRDVSDLVESEFLSFSYVTKRKRETETEKERKKERKAEMMNNAIILIGI